MKLFDSLLGKLGYVRSAYVKSQLDYAYSVGKRLDEHREMVEEVSQQRCRCCGNDLILDEHLIRHMATQDDYLMRLYQMVHGEWPMDNFEHGPIQKSGEFVRSRPPQLGACGLPRYL